MTQVTLVKTRESEQARKLEEAKLHKDGAYRSGYSAGFMAGKRAVERALTMALAKIDTEET